jgi:serralysin
MSILNQGYDVLPIQDASSRNVGLFDASADPYAGTVAANGKEIWTPDEAADNLNRYGVDFTHGNYGATADGVLTYGFWTFEQFLDSYFFELRFPNGEAFNDDAFFAEAFGAFEAFTAAQQVMAATAVEMWDDLINISIEPAAAGEIGDIMFGAALMSPAAGAHAYFPQAEALDNFYGTTGYGQTSGDVMINWYYNSPTGDDGGTVIDRPAATNFSNLTAGSYGWFAITHELGHSFGLAHGGDYNASDDNDGDGQPDPITYEGDAYFFQDSQQYTIMSYFDGSVTGQAAVRWDGANSAFMYAQTPAVHDILAVQNVYGADYSTRSGDTVYGFNSTANRAVFDFSTNTAPIVTIWDGGGNDTLDLSGFNANNMIDLNEGAFSSAGFKIDAATKAFFGTAFGLTTEADFAAFYAGNGLGSDGRPVDNIAIAYGAKIENAIGGSGDDLIIGNALDNVLKGGDGLDVIKLGGGNDTFVAEIGAAKESLKTGTMPVDVITDFDASGDDLIDLSGLGSLTFRGTSANKNAGDLTYKIYDSVNGAENALGFDIDGQPGASGISGPVTVVYGNTNGGAPDFALILLNTRGVDANDFIFANSAAAQGSAMSSLGLHNSDYYFA